MSCVNIRGCCIGEGRPKVIIPIVEPTETAVLKKAAEFSTLRADCVEWRIDCFEGAKDLPAIVHCAAKLRVALKDKLLLFTFRTKAEGGKVALSHEEYLHFIRTVLATDCADLIDIEFFTAGAELPALIEEAHTAGAAVLCSSHDFHKTPPRAELVSRMVAMQQAGADLPKLAVMPQSRTDVLELLAATAEMADRAGQRPGAGIVGGRKQSIGCTAFINPERSFYEKEVFCSPRTSFAKYFLHAYQLCASQHGAVFSASLEFHSVFCCHAVVCFGLFKDYPAVDRQTASRRPFVAWLHSHQHIYCILCRVHSRLVRIILTKKTGAVGRTYSSGLSFYVTKR